MNISEPLKLHLRSLIGSAVHYQGKQCTVVEFLEKEATLVLEIDGTRAELQDNQYGDPGRLVAGVFTIPIFDEKIGDTFHPELRQLGLLPDQ